LFIFYSAGCSQAARQVRQVRQVEEKIYRSIYVRWYLTKAVSSKSDSFHHPPTSEGLYKKWAKNVKKKALNTPR
jgi:hypothetical protein